MTTDTKRKPEDKIAEPPKKWRNWYKAVVDVRLTCRDERVNAGTVFCALVVHPSKEIAEAYALENEEADRKRYGFCPTVYLGAEPEQ